MGPFELLFLEFSIGRPPTMSLTYFKRYRMEIDLVRRRFDGVSLPPGYRLVPWAPDFLDDHAEAKFYSFRDELDSQVFSCLGVMDGCRKLMNEISHKEGFLPEATWLVEYVGLDGRGCEPCGTVQGIRVNERYGGIQNVGITPSHRGRGLSTALLAAALEGFQHVGLSRVYLEVTAQNERAIRLYQRLGFRRSKTLYKAVELAYS